MIELARRSALNVQSRLRRTRPASQVVEWDWLGSHEPEIRLYGHSHRVALRDAIPLLPDAKRARVAVLDLKGRQLPAPGSFLPHPDSAYWQMAANVGAPTAVVWEGNHHNARFLLVDIPFSVIGRNADARPDPAAQIVPFRMIRALFERDLAGLSRFLENHADPTSVLVVGTPPPKPEQEIRKGLVNDNLLEQPFFAQLMDDMGITPESAPVTSDATRVACWEALQEAFEAVAVRAGARFVHVPRSAQDDGGTLRVELCEADTTHANPAYGAIMWHEILDALGV